MKKYTSIFLVIILVLSLAACSSPKQEPKDVEDGKDASEEINLDELQTEAEASGWEKTTSSEKVLEFCKTVAENSDGRIILDDTTFETEAGTPIPYMIISDKAQIGRAHV